MIQQIYDNLLLSWPYGDRLFFAVGIWAVPTLTYWLGNGVLYLIYHFNLFSKYKIQDSKWPDREIVKTAVIDAFMNHFIIRPIAAYYLWKPAVIWFGMPIRGEIPSITTILLHFVVSLIVMDTLFYWAHRLLHHRAIYKYIHKKHHTFKVSIGVATEYAHPVEQVLANTIPSIAGPILLGTHYFVFLLWSFIRELETLDAHSGYNFPFSLARLVPFLGGADRHDFHHSHNVGNFGVFVFWDWLCGTDAAYNEFHQKKLEESKKKVN